VVRLVPRTEPLACDPKVLERVTAAAFGQRRKMLRQSLRSLGVEPAALLSATAIEPTERAEQLSVADFVRLANALVGEEGKAI
jgi:16S rRNA (adenine1518-N6/adenine1519-N6)-dimethyltransferase